MKKFLLGVGFKEDHIRVLTDDQVGTEWMPTRDNIIENLKWLIHGAKKNDRYALLNSQRHPVPERQLICH